MIIQLTKEILNTYIQQLIEIDAQIIEAKGNVYSTERWRKASFELDRPGKWTYSFLEMEKNTVRGCVITTEYKKSSLHINRFFVAPEHRKLGIGHRMVEHLIHQKKGEHIDDINLFVNVSNREAIQFYEKNQFYRLEYERLQTLMKEMNRSDYDNVSFKDENRNIYYAYSLETKG